MIRFAILDRQQFVRLLGRAAPLRSLRRRGIDLLVLLTEQEMAHLGLLWAIARCGGTAVPIEQPGLLTLVLRRYAGASARALQADLARPRTLRRIPAGSLRSGRRTSTRSPRRCSSPR